MVPPAMNYVSTRGQAPERDFAGVLLAGLAEDGGLFMPARWPLLSPADLRAWRGLPYKELAARVLHLFTGDSVPLPALRAICAEAYAGFDSLATVPLVQLETGIFVLELFHGPTLAFKDLAMQVLGRLFDHVLAERDARLTIVGATSGDTGSAAIEAVRGSTRIDIVILHPAGRTSEVQRRQMTTVDAPNVRNLAVEGDFDDCQRLVKSMFADQGFRTSLRLSAVNSINWARIAAQIPYYIAAALALGAPERQMAFAVPTGNFGNVFAAWAARRIGLPTARLIVGSNRNDILTRFLHHNDMSRRPVHPSLSPSMDIGISSNFERLLFELLGRDPAATAACMEGFAATGRMAVPHPAWQAAIALFEGFRLDDAGTLAEIGRIWRENQYLADPHTAVGIAAARAWRQADVPIVVAGTAHPAKFPDAMDQALGQRPALPPRLADLYHRAERYSLVANDLGAVQQAVRDFAMRNAA
jgi:threonine synthase